MDYDKDLFEQEEDTDPEEIEDEEITDEADPDGSADDSGDSGGAEKFCILSFQIIVLS